MKFRLTRIALFAAIAFALLPAATQAASPCDAPMSDGFACDDGEYCTVGDTCLAGECKEYIANQCTEMQAVGKKGGYFRIAFPAVWDGDLVIANHGFDLNDLHLRPHNVCSNNVSQTCEVDSDCTGMSVFCNKISFMGVDGIVLPKGKAIAAGTYHHSGWAPFGSAKDLKDIITYVKKHPTYGSQLKRVIITGFSGGGAVTGDAILKMKIDGAVPLCAAVGGGLPTWDVAMDIRLVYDFLCEDVVGAKFQSQPDIGEPNTLNSSGDSLTMALKVDSCFGNIGVQPDDGGQAQRLADFLALTQFSGMDYGDGFTLAQAMGFATLGLGDFVQDPDRLKGKRIGFNDAVDYSAMGTDLLLAAELDGARTCSGNAMLTCSVDADCSSVMAGTCEGGVRRLTAGVGRKKLTKASYPDFTKGRGKKVDYPIVLMAGAADWLVLPEFGNVFTTALTTGSKAYTQTWIDSFGHCVFTQQEMQATFDKFFDWLGPYEGPAGAQPTKLDIHARCNALGGVDGVTCNFNDTFAPGNLYDRIPERSDWPAAAKQP